MAQAEANACTAEGGEQIRKAEEVKVQIQYKNGIGREHRPAFPGSSRRFNSCPLLHRQSARTSEHFASIEPFSDRLLPFSNLHHSETHVKDGGGKQFEHLTADEEPWMVEQAVLASQDGRMPDENERERFPPDDSESS